jgi:hypothetical protein
LATQAALIGELILLYIVLPLLFDQLLRRGYRRLLFPGLWALATAMLVVLLADPTFAREHLTAVPWKSDSLAWVFARIALGIGALAWLARSIAPDDFLQVPKTRPALFVLIAFLYPVLSVVPQGLVWRVFFLHRYAPLLGSGVGMHAAAALAFAWAHIIFRNRAALLLTAVGGALFMRSYMTTGSMLLADLEHAAYGVAVFAFGLGKYLYLGWARGRA